MRAPGLNTLQFLYGLRRHGMLELADRLWRQYGDIFEFRIGARTFMFVAHPDAIERVTLRERHKYDKTKSAEPLREYLTGEGLVGSTGELWRRQRKLLAPFFTPKSIKAYADVMVGDAIRLRERWRVLAREGNEVEIADEMTVVTASIILRSMFGSETIDSIDEMRDAVGTMISFVTGRATGLCLPIWLPTSSHRQYFAARELVHRSIAGLIARRRATAPDAWPADMLSLLMTTRDEETGQRMSETLIRDEAITMFFAGHETTARTMTFTWYALAAHPHVAACLHAELDRELDGRPPTLDDLPRLPYALQVIKEVMRLHPPVSFYARDAIAHDQLGGYDVRPGTVILLAPFLSHRHAEFWSDPERFDPDRWQRQGEQNSRAYHPFGAGPRVCIGNHFSMLESHLLLAILAQRFTPRLRDGYEPTWDHQGLLSLKHGLPMTITARAAHSLEMPSQ